MSKRLLLIVAMAALVLQMPVSASQRGDEGPDTKDDDVVDPRDDKSYGYYVGKNLTEDGSVLLGGTGEEPSSHWLEIVPRQEHDEDDTITVGVTEDATIPGELTEIPQVEETYKYITMNYSEFAGFPPPLTNGGLNEHQVAGRDIWSPSRAELVEMTPEPQTGPQYSDLARIAMERATSAREAVEILGDIVDEQGFSTYGGNSHLFADEEEGWIMIQFAGGEGLWVAERLGPDDVRVSFPGYIEEIPEDYQDDPDYMGSDNLISFAEEQGWYDPDSDDEFNVHEVYGDQDREAREGVKYVSPRDMEEDLEEMEPVSIEEFMALVRDPRIADDRAGYGQVAQLRDDLPHDELATLWVAPTGSVTTPFVPWRIGVEDVPMEYGQHRYLTKDADATFQDRDYQHQEATEFAFRTYKRLMYYTCEDPDRFLPEVTEALELFEGHALDDQETVETTALTLYDADEDELAREYLTSYSHTQAEEALELGNALLSSIEARSKLLGLREPEEGEINQTGEEPVNCLAGFDTETPPDEQ